eukprot:gb/GECG01009788.1/.p1 GENE.gb/GECG01009788.1/~~gb/GECG01009788.1/.p1  ORF type:complete len:617 (+),score=92.44 gb/GECG01009788.1/:1-1851(+)
MMKKANHNRDSPSPGVHENGAVSPGFPPRHRSPMAGSQGYRSPEHGTQSPMNTTGGGGFSKSSLKQSHTGVSPTLHRKQRKRYLQKLYSQIYPDGKAHVSLLTQTRLMPPTQFQSPSRVIRPNDSEVSTQIMETLQKAQMTSSDNEETRPSDNRRKTQTESKEELKEAKEEELMEEEARAGVGMAAGSPSSGGSATHQTGESERTNQLLFHRTPDLKMGERVPYMPQAQYTMRPYHSAKKAMEYFNKIKYSVKSEEGNDLDKSSDFTLLAGASGRAGGGWKEAISFFNLAVAYDNGERIEDGLESYKKYISSIKKLPQHPGPEAAESSRATHPFFQTVESKSGGSASPGSTGSTSPNKSRSKRDLSSLDNIDVIPREEALALGYNSLAINYLKSGNLPSAVVYHAKHARVTQDLRSRAVALCNVGLVHRLANDIRDSNDCFRQALEIGRETQDSVIEMLAYGHLGLNCAYSCVPGENTGDVWSRLTTTGNSKPVASQNDGEHTGQNSSQGPPGEEEIANAKEALYIFLRFQSSEDDPRNLSVAHSALGILCHHQENYSDAVHHFEEARNANDMADIPSSNAIDKCHIGIVSAHGYFKDYLEQLSGRKASPTTNNEK